MTTPPIKLPRSKARLLFVLGGQMQTPLTVHEQNVVDLSRMGLIKVELTPAGRAWVAANRRQT